MFFNLYERKVIFDIQNVYILLTTSFATTIFCDLPEINLFAATYFRDQDVDFFLKEKNKQEALARDEKYLRRQGSREPRKVF